MQVEINNVKYNVYIQKKMIKNMYLRIKSDGIYITCPVLTSKNTILNFIYKNSYNIEKYYKKALLRKEKEEEFYFLGNKYRVILLNTCKTVLFSDDIIFTKNKSMLNTFVKKETERIFNERLNVCYNLFEEKISYPELLIGKMTRKWGYCNKGKNLIKLNSNLIRYSTNEIDYVIIHELSHLIEFNHSKNFWKIVAKYKKDYKVAQEKLKE